VALNENSRNLSVLSFGTQTVVARWRPPIRRRRPGDRGQPRAEVLRHRAGALVAQRQGWNSCAACHPDGLTDNVTWFFARARARPSRWTASYDPKDRSDGGLNWSGIFDEIHDFELNTRGNSGGVGAIVHTAGPPIGNGDRIIFDGTPAGAPAARPRPPRWRGLNGSTISLMAWGPARPAQRGCPTGTTSR
jgi:hypothetical protein